jgi:hypothetical protein
MWPTAVLIILGAAAEAVVGLFLIRRERAQRRLAEGASAESRARMVERGTGILRPAALRLRSDSSDE